MNVGLPCTSGLRWKPATLLQWIAPDLKNGRKIIAVSGSIDSTPSKVANAGAEPDPEVGRDEDERPAARS